MNENTNENTNENNNQTIQKSNQIFFIPTKKQMKSKLIEDFGEILKTSSNYSDFQIKVANDSITLNTHKSILSSRSPFFSKWFKENESSEIQFSDVNEQTMKNILEYIYTSKINSDEQNLVSTWILSNKFQLDLLTNFLENQILQSINNENVMNFIELNKIPKSNKLEKKCLNFISNHLDKFTSNENLTKLNQKQIERIISKRIINKEIVEVQIFEFIKNWSEKQIQSNENEIKKQNQIKQITKPIISKINTNLIRIEDIESLQQYNFLPNKLILNSKLSDIQEMKQQLEQEKLQEIQFDSSQNPGLSLWFEKKKKKEEFYKKRFEESILATNEQYKNTIKTWINDDEFFNSMKLGFSAKKDGFSSWVFHSKCDDKGKTLVIIKTTSNYIFGGFTQVGWLSTANGNYINDPKAFIFTLKNPANQQPQKFTYKNNGQAIYSNNSYGPTFGGGHDIHVNQNFNQGSYTNLGHGYNPPSGYSYGSTQAQSYLAGNYNSWQIEEVECYFV